MERPAMRFSGPCVETDDFPRLIEFYERFLGWEIKDRTVERDDKPPGWGWGVVRPADGAQGHKIEIGWDANYVRPTWPSEPGKPSMQWHLDWQVEDVEVGVAWAIECGAIEASPQPHDRDLTRLRIMLDPSGHPFCLWS
jgi:catechol 2,3-dioxygenase-like lactoylglutathione lyase family enzyme